jgi:hypothetical protein
MLSLCLRAGYFCRIFSLWVTVFSDGISHIVWALVLSKWSHAADVQTGNSSARVASLETRDFLLGCRA